MAENTRLKELATAVERLSENNKQRDTREADHANRIRNVETSLDVMHRSIDALTRNIERLSVSHPVNGAGGSDPRQQQPFHIRQVKLVFLRFSGSNPLHWLLRAEQSDRGEDITNFHLTPFFPLCFYFLNFCGSFFTLLLFLTTSFATSSFDATGQHGPRTGPDRLRLDRIEDRVGPKCRTEDRTEMIRSGPGRSSGTINEVNGTVTSGSERNGGLLRRVTSGGERNGEICYGA
nr:hypothetical protein [Tanacetum cinerariifolium]